MTLSKSISRRSALKVFGSAGALTVCMPISSLLGKESGQTAEDLFDGKLGPFVQVNPDNSITIGAPIPDMGTGTSTSLPMIVANELDADWESITIEMMPPSLYFDDQNRQIMNNVLQSTSGSWSIAQSWQPLRECGALARHLILKAASQELSISVDNLKTENSHVIVKSTGQKYPYSQFSGAASKVSVPDLKREISQWGAYLLNRVTFADEERGGPAIKVQGDGAIVGKPTGLKIAHDIVTGKIDFGIDKNFDNQLVAMIERCPFYYGKVESFDATETLKVQGVIDVIEVPHLGEEGRMKFNSTGVAVLASNLWAAKKGREALIIRWDRGNLSHENNDWHSQELYDAIDRDTVKILEEKGDVDDALENADRTFEHDYEVPFWEHFCMEQLSCSAYVTSNEAFIKVGHQNPETVIPYVAKATGVPFENIYVDNGRMGGGYGRKSRDDFVAEPVYLSQQTGRPV